MRDRSFEKVSMVDIGKSYGDERGTYGRYREVIGRQEGNV